MSVTETSCTEGKQPEGSPKQKGGFNCSDVALSYGTSQHMGVAQCLLCAKQLAQLAGFGKCPRRSVMIRCPTMTFFAFRQAKPMVQSAQTPCAARILHAGTGHVEHCNVRNTRVF